MAASLESILSKSPVPTVVDLPPMTAAHDFNPNGFADDLVRYTPIPTLVLDASLVVRQASDTYLEVSGLRNREDVVGHHADDIFNTAVTFSAHASAGTAIRTAQNTGSTHQQEHLSNDGRAWTIRAVPIFRHGSLRCVQMEFIDTTAERTRQLELEERLYTNETFRILVETVKDYAIFMLGNSCTHPM
jgi:osomolarity two-component system sensor histidine kinase TcsA